MHECSCSLSPSPRSIAHSSTAKAALTASPIFLARFPEPATEYNRSGLTNFNRVGLTSPNPVCERGFYLLRTRGLRAPSSPILGIRLGGLASLADSTVLGALDSLAESIVLGRLVPRTEHAPLGGLPLTSIAFHDFCSDEPRMRIDGLSASPGIFFARASASVATIEGCTSRGSISLAADTVFVSVFAIPIESGTGSAEDLAAKTPIAQPTYLSRSSTQEAPPAATPVRLCRVSALLGTPAPPSSTTR